MGLFGKFFGKRDTPASGTGVWRGPKVASADQLKVLLEGVHLTRGR